MLKNLFKKWKFKNKIYSIFIKQVQSCYAENKAIFLFEVKDEVLYLNVVLNDKVIIITKERNGKLSNEEYKLHKDIKDFYIQIINIPKFYDLVIQLKNDGETVESQHIIEYLNNNLKGMINYYGFERIEISKLYQLIINENIGFYHANPPAIILKTSANKWID